ncbi:MAG: 2-amino-4-hydroxy-6-hydroxymethyldihydropteridine diphosphokinase [Streptosporangiaceae bacterium]
MTSQRAVLALGSNLGDRLANLQSGLDQLCGGSGLSAVAVSPVYETAPVGGPPQPDYLNAVLIAATDLTPGALLERCHAAEAAAHRVRTQVWGPRTLDVDIVVYGDVIDADPRLTLPHPRAHERAFVLAPWHHIEPGASIPGRGRTADLLAGASPDAVRLVPDARLHLPDDGSGPQAGQA